MDDLSHWGHLSTPGWNFNQREIVVTPTEFHNMWRHFQDTGELPCHTKSRDLCIRLQSALDAIEADDG